MNAIEQAIEAMKFAQNKAGPQVNEKMVKAITALQSMQGEAVPVAYLDEDGRVVRVSIDGSGDGGFVSPNRAIPDFWKPLYTHPKSPAVVDGLDFDLIAAVLEDYCFLQTSGIVSAANRYSTSDVNEQIDLLTASGKGSDD